MQCGMITTLARRRGGSFTGTGTGPRKKVYTKYAKTYDCQEGNKETQGELEEMEYGIIIRVLAHMQIKKMKGLRQRKAHLMEIFNTQTTHRSITSPGRQNKMIYIQVTSPHQSSPISKDTSLRTSSKHQIHTENSMEISSS